MSGAMESWRQIGDVAGLWEHVGTLRGSWPLRTTAIATAVGHLLIVSPLPGMSDQALEELRGLGEPAVAVAPNHFHYLGIDEFADRFPKVIVTATETAARRLRKRLGHPLAQISEVQYLLPPHVTILEPPGTKNGEIWFSVERGIRTWIVTDAFFNIPSHLPGLAGLVGRATGTTAGLCIGKTWLWLALSDRRAYRGWLLDELERRPPAGLVMSHGDPVFDRDLAPRLRDLAESRL